MAPTLLPLPQPTRHQKCLNPPQILEAEERKEVELRRAAAPKQQAQQQRAAEVKKGAGVWVWCVVWVCWGAGNPAAKCRG